MRILFAIALLTLCLSGLPAAIHAAPVKLAMVAESPEAAEVVDLLTVEFSKNDQVQLLERAEIEKVYREQALSAGNRDYLKLGRLLGADGLLVLGLQKEGTNQFLGARLIAVKPGVVLTAEKFPWPVKDLTGWSAPFARHLNVFAPKLSVLVKDAVPISVVNLRSALASDEAKETEAQLKLLTIERLSREQRIFVLERQRMQLLSGEKELKADESAFWNGSYLLEGTIDQNGYSQDTVTLNGRLTPPKGGAPLLFEVSGSRTNLVEVENLLAMKVAELLKINSAAKEWQAADEAEQYFKDAQWALQWKAYTEAQMAADAAWALGKKDQDCATSRIRACLAILNMDMGEFQRSGVAGASSTAELERDIAEMRSQHKIFWVTEFSASPGACAFSCVFSDQVPTGYDIDLATRALEMYREFTRIAPDVKSTAGEQNNLSSQARHRLGVDALAAAAGVLRNLNYLPNDQAPLADKLANLRALARAAAAEMAAEPSVHDSYFVGDRIVTHENFRLNGSIFQCELVWGCFWQERPEDCLNLYRQLLASAAFCYLHKDFWLRQNPRLVAWTAEDRRRLPGIWSQFLQKLNTSSNVLWQLEAKALTLADARGTPNLTGAYTNFMEALCGQGALLAANNVEQLYADWGVDGLMETLTQSGRMTGVTSEELSLASDFKKHYKPRLQDAISANKNRLVFEKQKQYLATLTPYNFSKFCDLFSPFTFNREQAVELKPLIERYKSNWLSQIEAYPTNAPTSRFGSPRREAQNDLRFFEFALGNAVDKVLAPAAPAPTNSSPPQPMAVKVVSSPKPSPVKTGNEAEPAADVLTVSQFLAIPTAGLEGGPISQEIITAHHWQEGRLVLDFKYTARLPLLDQNGTPVGTFPGTLSAIAILEPETRHWTVVGCPQAPHGTENNLYFRTVWLRGELFNCDGGKIRKYNFSSGRWDDLKLSNEGKYELFTVNSRLFAANGDSILEILDGGKSTRLLASHRRQPPASRLDTEDLGLPILFEGAGQALRVATRTKIHTWTGNDWREDASAPPSLFHPDISPAGLLFRRASNLYSHPMELDYLPSDGNTAELCFWQKPATRSGVINNHPQPGEAVPQARWQVPPNLSLANLCAAVRGTDAYLFEDHAEMRKIIKTRDGEQFLVDCQVLPRNGYHAILWAYSRNSPEPVALRLKFEDPAGCPPAVGYAPQPLTLTDGVPDNWIFFSSNSVFFGLEHACEIREQNSYLSKIRNKGGVWVLPVSALDQFRTEQQRILDAAKARGKAERGKALNELQAKYDLNHNGKLDPEERENALDDTNFIASQLDNIDTNHNCRLDAGELAWFDANGNKLLDPKEETGVAIAQHLLAARVLKEFDADGDGALNSSEFANFWQSCLGQNQRYQSGIFSFVADTNHDIQVDFGELEAFLTKSTLADLHNRRFSTLAPHTGPHSGPSQKAESPSLKVEVEWYWNHPGATAPRLPTGGPARSGTGNF